MRTFLLALAVAIAPALAAAQDAPPPAPPPAKKPAKDQVYKWVDEKGVVHYTDKPPSDNATPAKLPPLQTYRGGTNPNLQKFDKPRIGADGKPVAPAASAGGQVDLVTPAHDETFHGAERTVPVAVVVTPALQPNQRLIYLLDGQPQSLPTSDTSFAFQGVDRGTHQVSVTLVDEAGEEIARSGSVTVHVKPPIAPRN